MAQATPRDEPGRELMALFLEYLIGRMNEALLPAPAKIFDEAGVDITPKKLVLPPAELAVIRSLLADNAVTFASVRKGDFGDFARQVAEEFPVGEDGEVSFQ